MPSVAGYFRPRRSHDIGRNSPGQMPAPAERLHPGHGIPRRRGQQRSDRNGQSDKNPQHPRFPIGRPWPSLASGDDVLRALDYFRRSGANPDPRMAEAVAVVQSRRQPDGRWLLDRIHPGRVYFDLEGGVRRREPLEHPPRTQGA